MIDVDRKPSRAAIWCLLLGVIFLAMAPTLPLLHFTDSMENFNALTAIEVARDGHWAVPTLWGYPRLEKPPLVHWLSAIGILTGGPLEFSIRWIPLLVTCLTLIVVYEWARIFANWKTALLAAAIAGTSIGFLRFGKRAAYDAPLMFWVGLTNLALTWALFRQRFRAAAIVGGIALGGALMTKGPPPLIHTLVPFAIFCGFSAIRGRRQNLTRNAILLLLVLGIGLLFLLPWVITVIANTGGLARVIDVWRVELSLENERAEGMTTPPWEAFVFFGLLAPWTIWYIGAIVEAIRDRSRLSRPLAYLLAMSLVPVAIHAFIPPMRDRYLLPMIPAAAIASALVMAGCIKRLQLHQASVTDILAIVVHVVMTLAIAAGYPLLATRDAANPIPLGIAIGLCVSACIIILSGVMLQRRLPAAIVITTVLAMLQSQAVFSWHESRLVRESEQIARDIGKSDLQIAGLTTDLPPRSFAIYSGKRVDLVKTIEQVPPRHALLTTLPPPAGSTLIVRFKESRGLWSIWQLPPSASTIPATYGK